VVTNLQLDGRLIAEAARLGQHRTKEEAVTQALTEYVQNLRQEGILDLFGSIDFDPSYDYKRQRAKS
jgi:Arc/MetJ family transcription regulator